MYNDPYIAAIVSVEYGVVLATFYRKIREELLKKSGGKQNNRDTETEVEQAGGE